MWDGDGSGGVGFGCGFDEVFVDVVEVLVELEEIGLWCVNECENGLVGGCGDEFVKLGVGELEKCGWFFGVVEMLENCEDGEEGGFWWGV